MSSSFGAATAYAKALEMEQDSAKIRKIVADIQKGDKYASTLAAHAEEVAADEATTEEE